MMRGFKRKSLPMKFFLFFILSVLTAFPACAESGLVSHAAVYNITLQSTEGGASSVVHAGGKMRYSVQKVCDSWQTETVFSLDISYELSGIDTTNWKQTTVESADGCRFDFDVFVRENGTDRKDLAGKARCEGGKKVLRLSVPALSEAVFPKNVAFPMQQIVTLIDAAKAGKKDVSGYVYDGTRPEALHSMHAVISRPAGAVRNSEIKGDTGLLKDKQSFWFNIAFYPEFKTGRPDDGKPLYEAALRYYDNGISDEVTQDFGAYKLRSSLVELKRLPDVPCMDKKKTAQALTTP